MGFGKELVRTLVLKFPQVLGTSTGHIRAFFHYMKSNKNIEFVETMKYVFEVPILLTTDVPVKSREIEEMFYLYHKIEAEEVTEVFKAFPYLYCCPTVKIQKFMGEFKKYRFTNK